MSKTTLAGVMLMVSIPALAAAADLRPKDAEPFQAEIPSFDQTKGAIVFVVPAGKRAVIEYVSVTCSDLQRVATAVVFTQSGGVTAPHLVPLDPTGGGTYTGAEHLRLYADPGTWISMLARNYETATYTCGDGAVSGYLVDAP
jgi:hypothetical protein